jgi:hypothetical protein
MRLRIASIFMLYVLFSGLVPAGSLAQTQPTSRSEYPEPTIREEQTVVVGGRKEVWQLKWTTPPKPVCGPEGADWSTCPCMGFAFGEEGGLKLVRLLAGKVIDQLDLAQFFDEYPSSGKGMAVVQRWQPDFDKDDQAIGEPEFSATVAKRDVVQLMHFGDYEHDGGPAQFYLQTESVPCGKSFGLVIGVSKKNPRLHVLTAASDPGKPLYLGKWEWEALSQASGPVEVLDMPCGDHGAETETRLRLGWTPQGVQGTRREYSCSPDDKPGALVHDAPL